MGAAERRRGADAERELSAILRDGLGDDTIRRNLGAARNGGDDITLGRYRIEAKNCKTLSMPAWLRQAAAQCDRPGDVPVVAFRQKGGQWYACIEIEHFVNLIREDVA